jgi:hypothetical protein
MLESEFNECQFVNRLELNDVKPWFLHYCRTLFPSNTAMIGETWNDAAVRLFRGSYQKRINGVTDREIDDVLNGNHPSSSIRRAMGLSRMDASDYCDYCGSSEYKTWWRFHISSPLLPKF